MITPSGKAVLGVDGCRGGWVGVLWSPDRVSIHVSISLSALLADCQGSPVGEGGLTRSAESLAELAVIGIDMPIGLPDVGARQADRLAQRLLGKRSSSIFVTPTRDACQLSTQQQVSERNRELSGPGVSIQAFHLLPKIREVDQHLQSESPTSRSRFVEVHPELAFASLHGGPLQFSKRTMAGQAERLEILAGVGLRIDPIPVVRRGVVEIDDVIDAAVVAGTAMRVLRGTAQCIPDPPETFSDGLPAAIWF